MAVPERTQVFISYSHEDVEWLRRLQIMLSPLTRNQTIDLWDDTKIRAGTKWREEIQQALAAAKAAEEESLTILWVAVSHSLYRETDIAEYQAANNPAKPLDSLSPSALNAELVQIAQKIRAALNQPITLGQEGSRERTPHQTQRDCLIRRQPFEPEMILIPAGEFLMGSDPQCDPDAYDDEQPQHRFYLPNYYLVHLVTIK
ncbi:MAG: TIR domain-containing protein [Candidatus Entotheonellia bacterium]